MEGLPNWALAMCGTGIGAAVGFSVRRARLCSFGAVEDALIGGDTRQLRIFGLALSVALIGTQAQILTGLLDPARTSYLSPTIPLLSIALGSLMFGLGMALVGTCSFGSLVRLGGGDLRSLIVLIVFGAVAYASLRGVLADVRINVLERAAIAPGGLERADLPAFASAVIGLDLRLALASALALTLVAWALAEPRLRRSPRLLVAGATLGLGIAAGWLVTGFLADDFAAARPQSLTFVAPVARLLYASLLNEGRLLEFGAGTLVGVVLGAFMAARRVDEFRWEAFDDDREMKRHLMGAVLMGAGGILAGGCTIGQGLTAGSLMALSWPVAVGGMILGARFGIFLLMGGSVTEVWRR